MRRHICFIQLMLERMPGAGLEPARPEGPGILRTSPRNAQTASAAYHKAFQQTTRTRRYHKARGVCDPFVTGRLTQRVRASQARSPPFPNRTVSDHHFNSPDRGHGRRCADRVNTLSSPRPRPCFGKSAPSPMRVRLTIATALPARERLCPPAKTIGTCAEFWLWRPLVACGPPA